MTNRPRLTWFGPGGQPFGGLRPYVALLLGLGCVAVGPVMLSDRAPSLFRQASRRVEAALPSWLAGQVDGRLPEPDLLVHLVIYFLFGLLISLFVWSWASLIVGQFLVMASGLGLELSQAVFTNNRSVELSDMVANLVGQLVGLVVALAVINREYLGRRRFKEP